MNTLLAASSGLIKWGLLGKILLLSAGISIGLVVLFTVAVNSLSAFRRENAAVMSRTINATIGVLTSAAIFATLVWGLYFIVHK
jgi:hypothetical protein